MMSEESRTHGTTADDKYQELFENATFGIYRASFEGAFLEVNPALVAMLGYASKQQLCELNLNTDIYERASDRAAILRLFENRARLDDVEVNWKRKDGTMIVVRLCGRAVRKGDGSLGHFDVIVEDVTQRKLLEQQFRQAQKMEAVGRLAGGVAHDINNLLMVIQNNAELLEPTLSMHQKTYTDAIRHASKRAGAVTTQLLAFSRRQVMNTQVVDLNELIRETEELLARPIGEDINLVCLLSSVPARAEVDPNHFVQVLLNLALNARDAMPEGGRLIIETQLIEVNETTMHGVKCTPGKYILVAVTDTGVGMNADTKEHIFEPFFTTKEVGKGTGLGLATVYGIVKQSGGFIWVYSEPVIGTTFKIFLPMADSPVTPAKASPSGKRNIRINKSVLLVEDEALLRAAVAEMLTGLGCRVYEAADGESALRLAQANAEIELLLSDIVLPDCRGPQLRDRIVASGRSLRVIYMSGYSEEAIIGRGVISGPDTVFLQKPFGSNELVRALQSAISEPLGGRTPQGQ